MHNHGGEGIVLVVGQRLAQRFGGDRVPAVRLGLDDGERAVRFELERVLGAQTGDFVFGDDGSRDAQDAGYGVEGGVLDLDGQL